LPARVRSLVLRMLEPDWRQRVTLAELLHTGSELTSPFPAELRRLYQILSHVVAAGYGHAAGNVALVHIVTLRLTASGIACH